MHSLVQCSIECNVCEAKSCQNKSKLRHQYSNVCNYHDTGPNYRSWDKIEDIFGNWTLRPLHGTINDQILLSSFNARLNRNEAIVSKRIPSRLFVSSIEFLWGSPNEGDGTSRDIFLHSKNWLSQKTGQFYIMPF